MAAIQVSRTLVKSPPELWAELRGERLSEAVGEVTVRPTEHERELAWESAGARGTALLEPSGWGTRVTLTAELEQAVGDQGVWSRLRGRPQPTTRAELEGRLDDLLDSLGAHHRRPFSGL